MCGCHESRNFIDHNSTFFSTAFIFFLLIGWTQDGMPHISLWLSACCSVTSFFVYVIPLFLVFIYQQDECLNIHNYGTTRTRETFK